MSTTTQTQNRRTAGLRLASKLVSLGLTNPVIIAIPHGGVVVGSAIAQSMGLHLNAMPCRKITDSSDKARTIGSVSRNEIVVHDCPHSLPQDYVYFKTVQLRSEIESEMHFYYDRTEPESVQNKTVILVDDILRSSDTMIACLRDLRKQRPLRIVVVVPFVEAEAARVIQSEADDLIFLKMQQFIPSPLEFYSEFDPVDDWEVRDLLIRSRGVPVSLPKTSKAIVPRDSPTDRRMTATQTTQL